MVPKVLVVGDVMADRYWIGTTTRVSPEAPIPVVKVNESWIAPGGAGNVRANLEAMGVEVRHVQGRGCPVKNRLMVGDTQVARWDEDDHVEPIVLESLDLALRGWVPDAIVVSDYGKGSIHTDVIRWIGLQDVPTYVDTKQSPYAFCEIRDVTFFPNELEYEQYQTDYEETEYKWRVVQKRGAKGLTFRTPGYEEEQPAMARFVKSVCGAGDVVLAAVVAGEQYKKGYPLMTVSPVELASIAAAIAVEKPYTAVVTLEEINARL